VKVTFLGTGTSQGVPVIACDCAVCQSPDPRDNRLRVSVLVQAHGKTICIDAGPDFRQQMLRAGVQRVDGILLTHKHKDHIAGLDDVRAFNFKYEYDMPIWADPDTEAQLRREFPYVFETPLYAGIPRFDMRPLTTWNVPPLPKQEPFTGAGNPLTANPPPINVCGIAVQPLQLIHGRMTVWGFRIGNFAYCTDVSFIPPHTLEQLRGLDVLVLGALRLEKHPTHLTVGEALEVIHEVRPRVAYLTHISHLMGRHADIQPTLPAGVFLAQDGLTVSSEQ